MEIILRKRHYRLRGRGPCSGGVLAAGSARGVHASFLQRVHTAFLQSVPPFFIWAASLVLLLVAFPPNALAATLPFGFTLDEPATTSAGVFRPDGTLVRTLWRKVAYEKGIHASVWDGLTDEKTPAPKGDYIVRVLSHNVDYVWQGAIGNTSTAPFGPTVHRGFGSICDLVITGNDAFFITGYVEGDFDFRHFSTSDPQTVDDRWCWYLNPKTQEIENRSSNIFCPDWVATDSDGTWVYFASPASTDPASDELHTGPGFIVASEVAGHKSATFAEGAPIPSGPGGQPPYANGIKVGAQKGVAGLAVERQGDTLAASVPSEGKIHLFHKRTGAPIGSIELPTPTALSFAPNGDLWVISGGEIKKIVHPAGAREISTLIRGLDEPLDLAMDPSGTLVAVVDGGASQQVKAYSNDGAPAWILGQRGGYGTNGPDVTRDKFMFFDGRMRLGGNVTFAPDGSFWVNDPGNRRTLHFDPSRSYLEEIMFQNTSYSAGVDAQNPSRVFCDFLEFAVDYSKPLAQGWRLARNWGANLPKSYFDFNNGLRQVATLANGRTYAVAVNSAASGRELVELTPQGTRLTGIILPDSRTQAQKFEIFTSEGNVRRGSLYEANNSQPGQLATFEEKKLTGFDAQNNPTWGEFTNIAVAPAGQKDPATRCCSFGDAYMPITTSDIIVSFDPTIHPGWHLGGVRNGGTGWLWKASPSVTSNVPLDGLGSFDIGDGVNYPGNSVFASGRNILFGYHGEFWNQSQAGQFMHFYDDGLFVGQFGEPGWGHESFEITVPGLAGNSAYSCLAEAGGKLYLWANDESQHGPQRWLISGSEKIREASATGTLGQAEALLVPAAPVTFPTNVVAEVGDARVSLTWNAVPGASSYNLWMSSERGADGTLIAGKISGLGKTVPELVNGKTYFFSVSAITSSGESVLSHPARATPVSSSRPVDLAGHYEQPGREPNFLNILPPDPLFQKPALTGLNPLLGDLTLLNVGSSGYRIFNWSPTGLADAIYLPHGDRIEAGTGWRILDFLGYQFRIGAVLGSHSGLFVQELGGRGTIRITPADDASYYLTVVASARFRDPRRLQINLEPASKNAPAVSYQANDVPAKNHLYQFRFRGPVDLSMDRLEGEAAIQAIFLDRVKTIPPEASNYSLWEKQNFPAGDPADPELEPTADYDHDGQSNLWEYASGTSPAQATSARPPIAQLHSMGGDDYLTLQFVRDRQANGISLLLGGGSSLSDPGTWTWLDAEDPAVLVARWTDLPSVGLDTLLVRDLVPAGAGSRFLRLSVTPF